MRDDRHKWPPAGPLETPIALDGATLSMGRLVRQTLISGPDVLECFAPHLIRWPGVARGDSYALSLRRDRVLLIGGAAQRDGWDDQQKQARSDASDAYAVFDLVGPAAFEILKRGAELSLTMPSASVARTLFGLPTFLYRFQAEDGFRLHVPRCNAEALVGYLQSA